MCGGQCKAGGELVQDVRAHALHEVPVVLEAIEAGRAQQRIRRDEGEAVCDGAAQGLPPCRWSSGVELGVGGGT